MESKICIIGAGKLSTRRIYPYIGAAGGQLVGVCDLDMDKAEKNARLFGGKTYSDYHAMIREQQPDGVIVCVGPDAHAAIATEVLKMKIPVYTEKPPAACAKDAFEVARVSKEKGVLCTTAFKKRYNLVYSKAKEWISAFDPAALLSISIDYASDYYLNDSPRKSLLLDFGIHMIDLAMYLFGDVAQVFSFAKGMDAYAVSLQFTNGAVGSFSLNDGRTFNIPTEEVEISVKGGNFMTIHNSSCYRVTENKKPCEWHEPCTFTSSGDSGNDTGHLAEIVDFFHAIAEKRTTRSNIYESYKTMVLYEAIRESAQTGKIVRPEYAVL